MIFLGKQQTAFNIYTTEAICWLNVKIKGRYSNVNRDGYYCGVPTCSVCKKTTKASSKLELNRNFTRLFTEERIDLIIKSSPLEMMNIISDFESNYTPPDTQEKNKFDTQCKQLIVKSGYSNWFQKKDWNYKLANLLDIHTCPYCNREYTFIYKPSKGKGMVPQFDHWYSKKHYPLVGLSFYNLIPSCATCNGVKSDLKMNLTDHLHPYLDEDISNSYIFNYIPSATDGLRIDITNKGINTKGEDTCKALNLPMIYDGHSSKELQDLYNLRFAYSDNYLDILLNKTFSSHLPISDQEKYRLIFGIEMEEEHYHKRIMSKFKKDIIDKLLSIK